MRRQFEYIPLVMKSHIGGSQAHIDAIKTAESPPQVFGMPILCQFSSFLGTVASACDYLSMYLGYLLK